MRVEYSKNLSAVNLSQKRAFTNKNTHKNTNKEKVFMGKPEIS